MSRDCGGSGCWPYAGSGGGASTCSLGAGTGAAAGWSLNFCDRPREEGWSGPHVGSRNSSCSRQIPDLLLTWARQPAVWMGVFDVDTFMMPLPSDSPSRDMAVCAAISVANSTQANLPLFRTAFTCITMWLSHVKCQAST